MTWWCVTHFDAVKHAFLVTHVCLEYVTDFRLQFERFRGLAHKDSEYVVKGVNHCCSSQVVFPHEPRIGVEC